MHDIQTEAEKLRAEISSGFPDKQSEDIAIGMYIAGRTEERELQRRFFGWTVREGYAYSYELSMFFNADEHAEGINENELFETFLKTQK